VYGLETTRGLIESVRLCWDDEIYLVPLTSRFLRVSLQLFSRYVTWIQQGINNQWNIQSNERISTLTLIYSDIELMISRLPAELASYLRVQLAQDLSQVPSKMLSQIDSGFQSSLVTLEKLLPDILMVMSQELCVSCTDALQPLRGILATYRMTNKPPPTQHSRFVPNVLKPLRSFLYTKHGSLMSKNAKVKIAEIVSNVVSKKYYEMAKDLLESVKKAEDVLRRLSLGKGGNLSTESSNPLSKSTTNTLSSDSQKIGLQLYLDVSKFKSEIESFDVDLKELNNYQILWKFIQDECTLRDDENDDVVV